MTWTKRLTYKDECEMRRMRCFYRAYLKRPNGVPFRADFRRRDQMEAYIEEAKGYGCSYVGFDAIDAGITA